jgi:hypothetical protein
MHDEWEYRVDRALRTDRDEESTARLNAHGKDGWELVSVKNGNNGYWTFFLKRPVYRILKG